MKKIIIVLLIIALLGGAGFLVFRWQQQRKGNQRSDLETVTATRGELIAAIGATGQVRSNQTATLSWKTSGTVENVLVEVGDHVKAGDKLADLRQTSLPQNVILAQADLVSAQKALNDLYTNAEDAKIQALQSIANNAQAVRDAQYQLDNYTVPTEQTKLGIMEAVDIMGQRLDIARKAFEPFKYLPSGDEEREDMKEKLDQAQSDYNVAVKRLEYEYQLEVAKANLEKARQDYEKWKNGPDQEEVAATNSKIAAAQATINQAWVEAPFDGTITLAIPQPGDLVSANAPAFRLDDLTNILVDLAVSEVDINQIKKDQDVSLTFDAIRGKDYQGVVVIVDRVGTIEQGLVDFTVTVKLIDPDEDVKPGMTAAVNIVVNRLEDALLVPNRAVRFKDGKQVVYVLKNSETITIAVKLGASSDTMSEVIDGELQTGDTIILNPSTGIESNGHPTFIQR
jgi:HlyD family secretion protein